MSVTFKEYLANKDKYDKLMDSLEKQEYIREVRENIRQFNRQYGQTERWSVTDGYYTNIRREN